MAANCTCDLFCTMSWSLPVIATVALLMSLYEPPEMLGLQALASTEYVPPVLVVALVP